MESTEPITIFKYGGNALETEKNYFSILEVLKTVKPQIIVVSAIGKTTNMLENLWKAHMLGDKGEIEDNLERVKFFSFMNLDLLKSSFTKKRVTSFIEQLKEISFSTPITNSREMTKDQFLVWGEMVSSWIFSQFLLENDFENQVLDASKFMITDLNFGSASVKEIQTQRAIKKKFLPLLNETTLITQGFIGQGIVNTPLFSFSGPTTLGRRTSDFSAVLIAKTLKDLGKEVDPVVLWRDPKKMLVKDPFQNQGCLPELSYSDAKKFCVSGSSFIHPKAIQKAEEGKIEINIKDFNRPNLPGTIIH